MNKRYESIQLKSFLVFVTALLVGVVTYFAVYTSCAYIAERYYITAEREEKIINAYVHDFQKYVTKNAVTSTDDKAIQEWCNSKKDVYLMIFSGNNLQMIIDGSNIYEYEEVEMMDKSGYTVYPINFSDKNCDISMIEYSDGAIYTTIYIFSLASAFGLAFLIVLLFFSALVKRIKNISNETAKVSENVNYSLSADKNDEIGDLYLYIENMRKDIIHYYEKQKEITNANRDLITNMSHDIRTPLTSIIGYNEMMLHPNNTPEEMRQYAKFSLEKANQLKNMSDKLFKYSLVYDSDKIEVNKEPFTANLLLQQLIGEQLVIAKQNGVNTIFNCDIDDVEISTDALLLKRVFDNIFSNIYKYADKQKPIKIDTEIFEGKVKIIITNYVSPTAVKKESTEIGLKSCRKIMYALGGRIDFKTTDDQYITTIYL